MTLPPPLRFLENLDLRAAFSRVRWRSLARDASSGVIVALIIIAYCLSYSALIFQGDLREGLALGLAALLTGAAVTGVIVALTTTLTPASAGPDTPAIGVISVLASTVAAPVLAGGGSSGLAVTHVMLAITLSTLLTGVLFLLLGTFRLGKILRFVPYPVIGGFLAASGLLLVLGAIEVTGGLSLDPHWMTGALSGVALLKLAVGIGFALFVFVVRKRTESFFVLPLAFFLGALALNIVLNLLPAGAAEGWFLPGTGRMEFWWPVAAMLQSEIDWSVLGRGAPEIFAVAAVSAVALLLDVSSLEATRANVADIDAEYRTNGFANLMSGVGGGVSGNLSLQQSILIEEAGALSRLSGLFAAVTIAAVLMARADVTQLVPTPLLGGLLLYVGAVILVQALGRGPAQRSWTDLALALAIMGVIVWFGYLVGVVAGLIGACLTFAFNYSRIGVVKRHLTRCEFSSNVERAPEQARQLTARGGKIHLFWLSGFIFFGSSNGVFETVRRAIDRQTDPRMRFAILDFSAVTGADTTAVLSMVKLRNYCEQHGVVLVLCCLSEQLQRAIAGSASPLMREPHRLFTGRNEALEWCEDRLLHEWEIEGIRSGSFEEWLARELKECERHDRIFGFMERRHLAEGTVLYRQGDPAESIDLVVSGRVAITVSEQGGRPVHLRSMADHTVVGEMGFFRKRPRTATVSAQTDAVVYTMTRASLERMLREEPALAGHFLQFIIRTLADRVEFANREIGALL